MRPEINLLDPGLLPPVERLPLRQVGVLSGVWLGVLGLVVGVSYQQLRQDELALVEARQRQATLQAQLAVQRTAARPPIAAEQLREDLERWVGERQRQEALLTALDSVATRPAGTGEVSEYLVALARARTPGLWIKGVSIDFDANTLSITGASQAPVHVPDFLAQLRDQGAFATSRLNGVRIRAADPGTVEFEVDGAPG